MEADERNMMIISALDITKERAAKKRLAALNRQLIEQNKELARQEAAARMMNEQLRNQQKQLKHAFEELSRRNFELDQFLYKVAHDIRAPITSLKGLVHLMEQEGLAPALQGYLDHMKGSIRRLDGFIRNMYTYASIEQKPLSFEPLDFEALLAEIAYELKEALNERKVTLDYKILGKQQPFAGDKVRLHTILHNIISNSIQYVDEKKERHEIKVEVKDLPRLAKLKIEDNGSGIDPHLQDKVFDMFFRGDERSKGAGLGLYIVKQIIEQLQGKIELKSKPGEGTSIEIEIPNQVSTN
jgi:signal transduction histidine kinase